MLALVGHPLRGASGPLGRAHSGREPSRRDEEPGVAVHAVLWPDGEALEVPAPHERLPGRGLGVAAVVAHRLGDPGQLGGGGDITDEHAAGRHRVPHRVEALPGGEHVQDDPVHAGVLDGVRQGFDEVADLDPPGRVLPAEEDARVAAGDVREVLAALEGDELPGVSDGPEQGHAQGAGPDAGLDDAGPGEDVGHRDDLAGVLGVDDRGAPRHRHHVVGEQGSQHEVLDARAVRHDRPVGAADDVVVGEAAVVGVELAAHLEGDRVQAALVVGQLDPVAHRERAAPGSRGGALGALGALLRLGHEERV